MSQNPKSAHPDADPVEGTPVAARESEPLSNTPVEDVPRTPPFEPREINKLNRKPIRGRRS